VKRAASGPANICEDEMAGDPPKKPAQPAPRSKRPLTDIPARAAAATLRPFSGAANAAVGAGVEFERRAVERLVDSPEFERMVTQTLDSPVVRAAVKRAVESDSAKELISDFFTSELFDQFVDGLLASDALWRLVDEIAASPAVTAAITQQSLSFADQLGDVVRARSRSADDWLEQRARRLRPRRQEAEPASGSSQP
jgi:hypothetical protein